jgi:serine/threonine-protein kinase
MLSKDSHIKLIDFNLMRDVGHVTTMAGTPLYMPPDLPHPASGIDHDADRYGAGVILYELIVHQHPYSDYLMPGQPIPREAQPLDPRTDHAWVSEALARLLIKCVAPSVNDRFSSAQEMVEEWRRASSDILKFP